MSLFSVSTCACGMCPPADPGLKEAASEFDAKIERMSFTEAERAVIEWATKEMDLALTEQLALVKAALPDAASRARVTWAIPAVYLVFALQALEIEPNSDRFHELMAAFTSFYNTHGKTVSQQNAEERATRGSLEQMLREMIMGGGPGGEKPSAN